MDWKDSGGVLDPEDEIYIHASPNNPDGLIRGGPFVEGKVPNGCSVVWDAAYAHRLYGWRHSHFPGYHDISVWSGGKLTGNTGARVGWLSTDDEFLADRARQYVEQTTSGVSVDAQVAVTVDLEKLAYEPSIADEFRESVSVNRLIITNALLQVDDDLTDHTDEGGMFMWVYSPQSFKLNKALKTAKIAVLRGEACGMKAPGWYRWSLGQSNEFTRNAMNALTKGL
jgi:aspartate/methionine/tyrosine aminotransferase